MSLADKLANATGSTRSAVMAQTKGKGKKKSKKGKGKGKPNKAKNNDIKKIPTHYDCVLWRAWKFPDLSFFFAFLPPTPTKPNRT